MAEGVADGLAGGNGEDQQGQPGQPVPRYRPPVLIHPSLKRKRTAAVTFQQICEEIVRGVYPILSNQYSFDEIASHPLLPEDDWEQMLGLHAKVTLDPTKTYVVNRKILVKHDCYVIGNGARITVEGDMAYAFEVCRSATYYGISGLSGVTFVHCNFETGPTFKGVVFNCLRHVTLHACSFNGFGDTVVKAFSTSEIRGCHFNNCFKCVLSESVLKCIVKDCYFTRCVMAVVSRGDVRINNCTALITYCFALLYAGGSVRNNAIVDPLILTTETSRSFVTCATGHHELLHSVHIVPNRKIYWPTLVNNKLVRGAMYLGYRRGALMLQQCSFFNAVVYVDEQACGKISFQGAYTQHVQIFKALRMSHFENTKHMCECGSRAEAQALSFVDITEATLPDGVSNTCLCVDFSSDEGG